MHNLRDNSGNSQLWVYSVLWIELSPHQNTHIEALTSNVTVWEDRASKEVSGEVTGWPDRLMSV